MPKAPSASSAARRAKPPRCRQCKTEQGWYCPRHIPQDWRDLFSLLPDYDPIATAPPGYYFDEPAALHVLEWIPGVLKHVKGARGGQPFILEPWQEAFVACLFGWKQPDGTRRYRELFEYVPRKNGKTPVSAAIALYILTNDDEPGIEAYSAAADRDQAALVYAHAEGMVAQEPTLTKRLKIYKATKSIVCEETFSVYKVISAIANTKHGYNSHLVIIDETHAQPDRELVDVLTTSTGGRRQPLILHTTTADFERPSICNEKLDYATRVRDGFIRDPAFLPVIYEGNAEKWDDEAEWKRVNPNLGVSKSWDYMRREYVRAKETPSYEHTFKRLDLNIKTQIQVKWLDIHKWDACQGDVSRQSLARQTCFGGLDLGSTSDLTALCLVFPHEVGYAALWWFWVPEQTAHLRRNRDRIDYLGWAAQGWIELTPGNETDYRHIRTRINAIGDDYGIQELAVDRLFQGAQLCQDLVDDFGEDWVVPFGQGFYSMAAPTKELEVLVNRGELQHDGNPVARWNAGNCVVEMDAAGNIKPSKRRSAEKIDGMVSLLMGLGRAMVREQPKKSVYEERGLVRL
jgi:phage terminase large subunit-like protein